MTRTGEREIGAVSGRVGMYAEILCWNDPKMVFYLLSNWTFGNYFVTKSVKKTRVLPSLPQYFSVM